MKANAGLAERYETEIAGVLGCFDPLVVTGILREIAHPDTMDARLYSEGIRPFDVGRFGKPIRQRIRDNAVTLAGEAGVEIEYLSRTKGVRKKDLVAASVAWPTLSFNPGSDETKLQQ